MDQKVMELLAKIYQTQTEMRSELKELSARMLTIRVMIPGKWVTERCKPLVAFFYFPGNLL